MIINLTAVYVLWLRELKRFSRAKSQMIGTLMLPLLLLISFGMGFRTATLPGFTNNYLSFVVPGIIAMSLMTRSVMTGFSVLWDREFGFLKEIMVAPVNRISIVFGRIAGGLTTSLIQAVLVLVLSFFFGFRISNYFMIIPTLIIALLTAVTFIGFGLICASIMRDLQGFGVIMNLIIFPLFFMSGALYPVSNLPESIRWISYIDPLTYAVDGFRASLIETSSLPLIANIIILIGTALTMVLLGTYLFEKSESV